MTAKKQRRAPEGALTTAEVKRLEQFQKTSGGQLKAAIAMGVTPETLSRTLNRHTAPSQMLRDKFIEWGIIMKTDRTPAPASPAA